jgi:hypothetical protein
MFEQMFEHLFEISGKIVLMSSHRVRVHGLRPAPRACAVIDPDGETARPMNFIPFGITS